MVIAARAKRSVSKAETGIKHRISKEDGVARLAEIPADTRTLTGVLLGDPLPGRRALDRRPA